MALPRTVTVPTKAEINSFVRISGFSYFERQMESQESLETAAIYWERPCLNIINKPHHNAFKCFYFALIYRSVDKNIVILSYEKSHKGEESKTYIKRTHRGKMNAWLHHLLCAHQNQEPASMVLSLFKKNKKHFFLFQTSHCYLCICRKGLIGKHK